MLVVALLAGATACQQSPGGAGGARAAAEAFLDAHYVRVDLGAALELSRGLAASKVSEEIDLTRGLDRPDASQRPRIHYRLLREREGGGESEARFLYELTVSSSDAEPFQREVIVTARLTDAGWKVTNYTE